MKRRMKLLAPFPLAPEVRFFPPQLLWLCLPANILRWAPSHALGLLLPRSISKARFVGLCGPNHPRVKRTWPISKVKMRENCSYTLALKIQQGRLSLKMSKRMKIHTRRASFSLQIRMREAESETTSSFRVSLLSLENKIAPGWCLGHLQKK